MRFMKADRNINPFPLPTDAAEGFAIGGALLCLVHCLFLPLLLAWAPTLGHVLNPAIDLHLWLVMIVGPVSVWLLLSVVRLHRLPLLVAGFAGLGLLIFALTMPATARQETLMSVTGSVLLAATHAINWALRRRHRHGGILK
jgi:hypothetical protein